MYYIMEKLFIIEKYVHLITYILQMMNLEIQQIMNLLKIYKYM